MELISKADWEKFLILATEIAVSPNHSLHSQAVFLLQAVENGEVVETQEGFRLIGCALQKAYQAIHGDRRRNPVDSIESG